MAVFGFYVSLNTMNGKKHLREVFINLKRMEMKVNDIYELEVVAFSESVMNLNNCAGICYFQCRTEQSYLNLKYLVRELLEDESYKISSVEKYCCDSEFVKGFIIWRMD